MNRKRNATTRTPKSENSMAQDICGLTSMVMLITAMFFILPDLARYLHG
jgi:hypothetical protein